MKKFLPSKKFIYALIIVIVLGIIFFLIFNFSPQKKFFFFSEKKAGLQNERSTINDVVKQDTDTDGVPDWEETLWGTDKNNKTTFDSVSDLVYIKNKKTELNIDTTTKDYSGLTETEKFAREFFATYVAMKTAGNDPTTINNFSNALGQKIIYPSLVDSYSEENLKTKSDDSLEDRVTYYLEIKKIFESYQSKGMGDELSIVASGLTSAGILENSSKLLVIANAYQDFAKKIMNITVPQSLIPYHLKIANGSNNTGLSVISMTKITNDPIVGLSGLSQYEKYSDEFIKASEELETKIQG